MLACYINHDLDLSDHDINSDQKVLDDAIVEAFAASDTYRAIVDDKVGSPVLEPPSATMEGLLTSLCSSNKIMVENISKKKGTSGFQIRSEISI